MKVRIDRSSPTADEVGIILGRRVREIVEFPDGVVELELDGDDALTEMQKESLSEQFRVPVARVAPAK